MAKTKLLLDTNILIDFLIRKNHEYESTRLLMLCGKVGEFSLWISSSQVTDMVYLLSKSKNLSQSEVLSQIKKLRSFIGVYAVDDTAIDKMLDTQWKDPEDALLYYVAEIINASAIISRNGKDFEEDGIPVLSSAEFFEWMRTEHNINYAEIEV